MVAEAYESPRATSRGWTRWLKRGLGAAAVLGALYVVFVIGSVILSSQSDDPSDSDAIVVLGAAQYDGQPSPVFQTRLDHAYSLYSEGVADTVVLTGSKQETDRFTEAYSGFTYLLEKGLPEESMLVVSDGDSTYESLAATARLLESNGISEVTMVSDGYHSRRLVGIAAELGLDGKVSPSTPGGNPAELARESVLVGAGEILGYRRLNRFS